MGIRDITSTVFTRYKTDTADHERGVRRISDAEQKRNVALAKQLKQQEAGFTKMIGTIGKVTLAIGAVTGVAIGAGRAMKTWAEDTRMRAAAAGISIDKLRAATEGLITKQDLLGLAAANQNTAFKVTQAELENVSRLMIDLNRQGNDMAEVQKEVTKALNEGTIEGLKKFGVNVHGIKPGLDAHNKLLELAAASTGGLGHAGENATKSSVALKDALHDASVAIGKLANDVLPGLISKLATVIEKIAEGASWLDKNTTSWGDAANFWSNPALNVGFEKAEELARRRNAQVFANMTPAQQRAWEIQNAATQGLPINDADAAARAAASRSGSWAIDWTAGSFDNPFARYSEQFAKARAARKGKGGGARRNRLEGMDPFGLLGQVLPNDFQIGEAAGAFADLPGVQQERFNQGVIDLGKELLGKAGAALGKGEETGRKVVDGLNQAREVIFQQQEIEFLQNYGRALGIVEGAAQSMFTAMVTGSKGAGEALREFLGQSLLGEGTRLIGVAVTESVLALAALASGNFVGAGAHGKAAAAAAAGAVTLGTLASAMGAGGSMPGASAAGRGIGAGVGAAGGRTVSNTYIIGGDMLSGSARQNAANMRRALERADREDNGNRDAVGVYG